MIHVLAIITAKPGQRDAFLEQFCANVPAVLAEDGCLEYGPTIDSEPKAPFQTQLGPDSFAVIEKWATPAALKAHAGSAHMVAYGARVKDMLASRVIHILSPA